MGIADESGVEVVMPAPKGRFDQFSPSIDELTGLGPESDRDGAIIALSQKCGWSTIRLATLFSLSASRVRHILADFEAEYGEV